MISRLTGLWRHSDFLRLWAGETISLLGSQVTLLALPLTAVTFLHASAAQMGYLSAAEMAPFLVIGVFAGVWVDRMRRKRIMMVADLGRFLLLLLIPVLDLTDALRMEYLYAIAFLVGVLTLFFDVAYQSYLTTLVGREYLVEGNSKLEVSESCARVAGPSLAGGLISLVTAPIAILADAISFLWSAAFLYWIHQPEFPPARPERELSIWRDVYEGLRLVLGNPLLRSIAGCTGTSNFFGSIISSLLVLYATRELGISAGLLGIIFASGSVGAVIGSLLSGRVPGWIGLGWTIVGSATFFGLANLFIPLASGPKAVVILMLTTGMFISGFDNPLYNVNQVSLRQIITPDDLQGRMNATMRFIVWGTIPLGSLVGGALGTALGVREALFFGAIGSFFAMPWVFFSPVRRLKQQPAPTAAPEPDVRMRS